MSAWLMTHGYLSPQLATLKKDEQSLRKSVEAHELEYVRASYFLMSWDQCELQTDMRQPWTAGDASCDGAQPQGRIVAKEGLF